MVIVLISCSPTIGRSSWSCDTSVLKVLEQFWQTVVMATSDDQVRVNRALDKIGIEWQQLNHEKYYQGVTTGLIPLKVTTLPSLAVCCNCQDTFKDIYYVWHHHAARNEMAKKSYCTQKLHLVTK